jgi:quercetin dioxygenase-like cupin family protein
MIIKSKEIVPYEDLKLPGVKKQVLIGPRDLSEEISLRLFTVAPGGATPYHSHEYSHIVKVEKGEGIVFDSSGYEHPLHEGQIVFIQENEVHGFKNFGSGDFEFLCIVPGRAE